MVGNLEFGPRRTATTTTDDESARAWTLDSKATKKNKLEAHIDHITHLFHKHANDNRHAHDEQHQQRRSDAARLFSSHHHSHIIRLLHHM